ncbi:TIGR02757 family protein [Desulfocicer vacuolatum DSM 3385]|uniref:TIGR02757 family protein n=1 Tax=Desulfocicer vacuolatum DSM 3385 TaxID=1121400 RepID=A0A1W2DG51_9BACT|nr:TIGR02757 family protein [Desulfocicer vacuolatum]SMC95898.1 TIGR02757 family protein [Desulfocicer vacuolatum DSM 3385]
MPDSIDSVLKKKLEFVFEKYNKRSLVQPDPLQFLYQYSDVRDREIVALIASSLAYGRVAQILKAVEKVLAPMGKSPREYLCLEDHHAMVKSFESFKYRFATGAHVIDLLSGIREVVTRYGSLEACFAHGESGEDSSVVPALSFFTRQIKGERNIGHLMADPAKGSACKRSCLFLRWMVRKDAVDPGGWTCVPASRLMIPLDTHMHNAGRMLGFTKRKQANMKTVREITQGFARLCPDDPVKYDFSLTRFGIHPDMDIHDLENLIQIQ